MTLKIEFAIMGSALFGAGAFYAVKGNPVAEAAPVAVSHFTQADYNAFDRNFQMDGQTCAVGFRDHRICFGASPYEAELQDGDILPAYMPALSAEFRVIVETDLKADGLQTVRFGRSLALIDPETRQVRDVLRLDAPNFRLAREPDPTRKS
ncbi:MAG TPA: hypothetical protein PLR76_04360 [Hyphomonas sp.]|nr:hypothetical protein [Hyphomonas sp.]HPE47601.1 hypothetical protein [Hyphomonas sp.]